jgi:hypothetical protein
LIARTIAPVLCVDNSRLYKVLRYFIKVLTLLIKSHAHAFILAPCVYYTMPIALASERKQIRHGVVSRVNRTWEILTTRPRQGRAGDGTHFSLSPSLASESATRLMLRVL